jgi:hypothetical protein
MAARIIRIPPRAVDFDVRGFAACDPAVRQLLELHGLSFATGFNAAIAIPSAVLAARLDQLPPAERGFAFEGAGMALALLDLVVPVRTGRVATFFENDGATHTYMIHVGAGWALARLGRRPWGRLRLDPLLRWLALDGYGFHDGFFHPQAVVRRRNVPRRLSAEARRIFDQGVGRALWFVDGADPERIAGTIEAFEEHRRADLWSGTGLAAAYAGGIDEGGIARLLAFAGRHGPHLAQGAAFAAKARIRAGNLVPHTEQACALVGWIDAETAAAATDLALERAGAGDTAADYERWRGEIRTQVPV